MSGVEKILDQMRREPANVRFGDLQKVCEKYFGKSRNAGGSHSIFKTPWQGDPRVNIQNDKGKAKAYQVNPDNPLERRSGFSPTCRVKTRPTTH